MEVVLQHTRPGFQSNYVQSIQFSDSLAQVRLCTNTTANNIITTTTATANLWDSYNKLEPSVLITAIILTFFPYQVDLF
jgi:hypothetical protein